MIDSIGGGGMSMPPQRIQATLSNDQQALLEETLQKYDLENLTEDDAKEIVQTFSDAGIRPGQALEEAMSAAGADAKEIGDLAGVKGPKGGPPPPPPGGGAQESASVEISSLVDYLEELLAEQDAEEMTETDRQEMYAKVAEHFGLPEGQSFVNLKV
jgi:hypothetical protein